MKAFPPAVNRRSLPVDRRGVASIEFAISGTALFLFLFGILNLGEFGFTIVALQQGVEETARYASVATAVALANGTAANYACMAQPLAQTEFNNAVSPPFSTATAPSISVTWGGSLAACSNATGMGIGTVTVSAQYQWYPIGLIGVFPNGITLSPSETLAVMNSGSAGSGS